MFNAAFAWNAVPQCFDVNVQDDVDAFRSGETLGSGGQECLREGVEGIRPAGAPVLLAFNEFGRNVQGFDEQAAYVCRESTSNDIAAIFSDLVADGASNVLDLLSGELLGFRGAPVGADDALDMGRSPVLSDIQQIGFVFRRPYATSRSHFTVA
jgi:hypothetical protein